MASPDKKQFKPSSFLEKRVQKSTSFGGGKNAFWICKVLKKLQKKHPQRPEDHTSMCVLFIKRTNPTVYINQPNKSLSRPKERSVYTKRNTHPDSPLKLINDDQISHFLSLRGKDKMVLLAPKTVLRVVLFQKLLWPKEFSNSG